MTLAVNHLAPFLLSHELLSLLGPGAQVITVSSSAHRQGHLDFSDLQRERRYTAFGAYAQSKLANVLFAYELARRHPQLSSNALHPGVVNSGFGDASRGPPGG